MKVRRFYDKSSIDDYEAVTQKSETVPDQSLTVREIISRFTRGQMVIPPIDTGDDDDIDSPLADFEDPTDALEAMEYGNELLHQIVPRETTESQQSDTQSVEKENPHE